LISDQNTSDDHDNEIGTVDSLSAKKGKSVLTKDFLLKIVLPTVLVISIVNIVFDRPESNEPKDIIQRAWASGNHEVVCEQLKQLIDDDFYNLKHHRSYIKSRLKLARSNDISDNYDATKEDYIKYSLNEDPNISDIGYYGLGLYHVIRNDYPNALEHYNKVRDKGMSFLNNSIGYVYLNMDDNEKAKEYFYGEIKHNGNVGGAYFNLSKIFYKERDFGKLSQLISDDNIKYHIPNKIIRITHLKHGFLFKYITSCFKYDFVTGSGFIAALLILIVWFQYLRKIDVFEPEKIAYLLVTLIGGMFFAEVCTILYDFFDYGFNLKINGKIINDLFYCMFGIGLIEETVKIIPFLLMLKFSRQVNESIDYVIYASVSALGFAFMENLIYFQDPGLKSITGRTLMSVLLHMSLSTFAMYGIFYSRYKKRGQNIIIYFMAWFSIAVIAHGLYDFCLMAEGLPQQFKVFSVLILAICVNIFSIIIKNALNKSEFNAEKKTRVESLSKHLIYSILAIALLQYVLMAWKFGAYNANKSMLQGIFLYFFLALIIISNLGTIEITKSKWIPFFKKKNHKVIRKPVQNTEEFKELKRKYGKLYGWVNFSLLLFIFLFIVFYNVSFSWLASLRSSSMSGEYLILPSWWIWSCNSVVLAIATSVLFANIIFRYILGKDKYDELNYYDKLVNERSDGKLIKSIFAILVVISCIGLLLCSDYYINVKTDEIIIDKYFGFSKTVYSVDNIKELKQIKSQNKNGRISRNKYHEIVFDDGYILSLDSDVFKVSWDEQLQIIKFIAKNRNIDINTIDPYPK